jgi:hypothetical protein
MRLPAVLDDGTYAALSTHPFLVRTDHPSMLMAYGWLPPGALIDKAVMEATLDSVWRNWDLQSTWGWDYPVLAMTAAELGDLERAVEALLWKSPKNVFLPNGHSPQMRGFLSVYLPSNGALLAAVAHIGLVRSAAPWTRPDASTAVPPAGARRRPGGAFPDQVHQRARRRDGRSRHRAAGADPPDQGRGHDQRGAAISPFNAWLIARGSITLPLRLRQHLRGRADLAAS